MGSKYSLAGRLKGLALKKTWWTRLLAVVLALAIIVYLLVVVDRQVGNPLSAWYNEKKILAHYNEYHAGEGYVVGPAVYQWVYSPNLGLSGNYYVCRVYKAGSVDTGFCAVFQNGAVLTTYAAETQSGNNTYNRFRNQLQEQLDRQALAEMMERLGYDYIDAFAQFYANGNNEVFSLENPVFRVDAHYDPDNLPLPTVLCAFFGSGISDGEQIEQMLAERLCALKRGALAQGAPFDYYSAEIHGTGGQLACAYDVPAEEIPGSVEGAAGEAFVDYLENLPQTQRESQYFYEKGSDRISVNTQKSLMLNSSNYQVCGH